MQLKAISLLNCLPSYQLNYIHMHIYASPLHSRPFACMSLAAFTFMSLPFGAKLQLERNNSPNVPSLSLFQSPLCHLLIFVCYTYCACICVCVCLYRTLILEHFMHACLHVCMCVCMNVQPTQLALLVQKYDSPTH